MSDFIHIKAVTDGKEYYIKVDATKGATIITPGTGAIALSKEDVQKIVDFRAGFDYTDVLVRRRKIKACPPDTLEYNVLNEETEQLVLVAFVLKTNIDQPEITFSTVDVTDGKELSRVVLPFTVVDVLLREFASKGYVTQLEAISDILYVDKLPNETAAESGVVYQFENEFYVLNAKEDGFDKLTGTFEHVNTLPEFTPRGKAGVLYQLVSDWTYQSTKDKYTRGVYTFDGTTKVFTLTDLKMQNVRNLPEVDKATENVIYVLTKADGDKAKGSRWTLKDNAFVEETREVITDNSLPVIPLATAGVYYIVADRQIQLATENNFTNKGVIKSVKALPDTTKIQIDPTVVYVLTKAQGEYRVGTKLIFNDTKKEFEVYSDETIEGSGEGVEEQPDNP